MSISNIIILTDTSLVFSPGGEGRSLVSIPYDDRDRLDAFIDELSTACSGDEYEIVIYSKSEELIVSEAPELRPWERDSFIKLHREENYSGKDNVLAYVSYSLCDKAGYVKDWIIELGDPIFYVYERLLSSDILVLSVSSVGFSLSNIVPLVVRKRSPLLKIFSKNNDKYIAVIYDCEFIYFFIFSACGVVFFRHTALEREDGEPASLIIREVDLTVRFALSKGLLNEEDLLSFYIFVPETVSVDNDLLQDRRSFISLSLLQNLTSFRLFNLDKIYGSDVANDCFSGDRVALLSNLFRLHKPSPVIRTKAGRIKSAIFPISIILWVTVFVVAMLSSYFDGRSIAKYLSLNDAIATLDYQYSKLRHVRNVIQKKLNLAYDPSDMYQLVLFNKSVSNIRADVRWTQIYYPIMSVLHEVVPHAWVRQFSFDDGSNSILKLPEYNVTVLVGFPFEEYSLQKVYELLDVVVNRLRDQHGVSSVKVIKYPFDPAVNRLLKVDVESYKKKFYFFMIAYSFDVSKP